MVLEPVVAKTIRLIRWI